MMQEFDGSFVSGDGRSITFRHIRPEDSAALQRFHSRLSERSIYQRFFEVMPRLSDSQARYFTGADGVDRVALVAIDPDDPAELIGVVRFDRDPGTDRGEYAAIVEDRWQGKGIGWGLTLALVDAARIRDVRRLYALVLPGNGSMLGLLHDLGYPETRRFVDGVERVELTLWPETPVGASPS